MAYYKVITIYHRTSICITILLEQCVEPCLLYANGTTLVRQGTKSKTWSKYPIMDGLRNSNGPINVLYEQKRLVWHNNGHLILSNFVPDYRISVISSLQIGHLVDFTIDWNHNLVYWSDDKYQCIRAALLDGRQQSFLYRVTNPSFIEYSFSVGKK